MADKEFTAEDLIKKIEKIYGEYKNKALKSVVISYLKKDIKDDCYKQLWNIVLYFHKVNFGIPCIATFEECIENARKLKGKMDIHKTKEVNSDKYNYISDYQNGDQELKPAGSLVEELARKIKNKTASSEKIKTCDNVLNSRN